jgi:hypothetical protein
MRLVKTSVKTAKPAATTTKIAMGMYADAIGRLKNSPRSGSSAAARKAFGL